MFTGSRAHKPKKVQNLHFRLLDAKIKIITTIFMGRVENNKGRYSQ